MQLQQAQNTDDIASSFQKTTNVSEISEVLKELFKEGKIYMITELSKDEIRLMTRMYMLADMHNLDTWKAGLVQYCKMMLSHKRSSRREILDAIGRFLSGGNEGKNPFSNLFKKF